MSTHGSKTSPVQKLASTSTWQHDQVTVAVRSTRVFAGSGLVGTNTAVALNTGAIFNAT